MHVTSFGYAGLHSSRLEDWAEYGPKFLGLELVERTRTALRFRMDDRSQRIVVSSEEPSRQVFGWEVDDAAALDTLAGRLEAAKVAVTRLDPATAAMRGVRAGIDQVMTCQPTHVIMGVALEAFWGGVKAADELQAELAQRSGVGVSMGSTATVAALRALGAKNIAVLTPHQPRGDEQVRNYFDEAGFPVKRLIGMKCPSPVQIAHTTPQQVIAALRELEALPAPLGEVIATTAELLDEDDEP